MPAFLMLGAEGVQYDPLGDQLVNEQQTDKSLPHDESLKVWYEATQATAASGGAPRGGRGGGGGGLPFSSGGGSLNDGSGKSIKMDAPVVKAWKKASGYTRGSYYALAVTIFLVYYGYSSLRYWNCTSNFCLLDESRSKVVEFSSS